MKKKVYCEDCSDWAFEQCNKVLEWSDSYRTPQPILLEACEANKHNDCKYYQEKWHVKLFKKLFRQIDTE